MSYTEFKMSSAGHPIVHLVWEQAPKFLALRCISSSEEEANIVKTIVEKEYTQVKNRLIYVEKSEIDHMYGRIEMHTLEQVTQEIDAGRLRYCEHHLKECRRNYKIAVEKIRELTRK